MRQHETPGDVEHVVAGETDAKRRRELGGQRALEQPLEVGVDVVLRRVGRLLPTAQLGLHLLHRQVGPLHDADLDAAPGLAVTGDGPRTERFEHGERIRQIGLQGNAGVQSGKRLLIEKAPEDSDRQREVVIFLHVEIDELGRHAPERCREQRPQSLDHPVDGDIERQRADATCRWRKS